MSVHVRSWLLSLSTTLSIAAPARAADPEEAPWQPGNPTTSRVEPSVTGDSRSVRSDGVYGRFDGDLDLGVHGGVQVGDAVAGAFGVTLHYMSMAGIYGRYADGFGAEGATPLRSLSVGVDVRPAFVPRWASDAGTGDALWDLMLDSISLELGAYFASLEGSLDDERGFESSLGFGIPLMSTAQGLWIDGRGLLRWPDLDGPRTGPEAVALVTVSWHALLLLRN